MTGDLDDIIYRLRSVLPHRWFSETSPNLNAVLSSIATPWVWLYGLISYVISQTRLASATDDWLDLIAADYFGSGLIRKPGEGDASYRSRIQAALVREAATRSAVSEGLTDLIGRQPSIFEPANCMDTGCYGASGLSSPIPGTGMAYGQAGGWGSLDLPFQFFITCERSPTPGVGLLAGYSTLNGGYGQGQISYIDLALLPGHVTDTDIRTT